MTTDLIPDPYPVLPRPAVDIAVRPPGSKSQTNRSLVLASLADGRSQLQAPLVSDDSSAMRRCLRELGVSITDVDGAWVVTGTGGAFAEGPPATLDARASGTTARFITGVAALVPRRLIVDGTARMRERPIGPLVQALASMGAEIADDRGFPPVTVEGFGLRGGEVDIDASISSQFLSALLMVAPCASSDVVVRATGLASAGYVGTTLDAMRAFGVEVGVEGAAYSVPSQSYSATDVSIEADASAAVYVWGAAAITGGRARVDGIPVGSRQPDLGILAVLREMGCRVDGHAVEGRRPLRPVDVDLSHMPDGAMTVAVLCAAADGVSRIDGLATLRLKETDRLAALVTELRRLGVQVGADGDALVIEGGRPMSGATIHTYDDHRMAMAFSLLGLVVEGIAIADPACVAKTWPGYFEELGRW